VLRCSTCGHENRDGARFCDSCGAGLEARAAAGEQRKTVTVLFSDVTGSTALGERLDPESLRAVMSRYFDVARAVVERHGGSVEKFIGDAVMAVFGIPRLHEDDALRAVRAAAELREGVAGLNDGLVRDYGTTLDVRIGVNTGEVVTGTEERLATGDAVNVAARLEQAAQPGEILVGVETRVLVGDAVTVEAAEPLRLKGKARPVDAYRLVAVHPQHRSRRLAGVMIGRGRELARLEGVLAQASADRSCQLFTVLGAAGVGKSRLVYEFLRRVDGVTVVRGGCLSYGEGITYWPVVEVLKQLLDEEPERRLETFGLDASAAQAVQAVLGERTAVTSVEEIARAFRRVLETAAAEVPLVAVLDDIHWGEDVFLDLVDHVADLSRDVPILLLCMARPELLDRRPNWGGGKLNATTVLLEPLAADDAAMLAAGLLDGAAVEDELRTRILEAAEGNPLFVEEMIALVRESSDEVVAVPPTIHALLAARLDQLDPVERVVLERGSVEGRVFHRGAVQALSPDETHLTAPLTALVRRELLRPDRPQFPGEDAFRFRHLLIRDAAYDALPKSTRAELHERFAAWMDEHGADLVELDEIVGYHLERAYRYRAELGRADEAAPGLADRAAARLGAAGTKAVGRGDMRAAANLLGRAADLLPPGDPRRLSLLPPLGRALHELGEWSAAEQFLMEAVKAEDRTIAADGAVALTHLRLFQASYDTHASARRELEQAASVFEEVCDEGGLARALGVAGQLRFWAGQSAAALVELDRSVQHARNAGDRPQENQSLHYSLLALMIGPTPAGEALERIAEIDSRLHGHRRLEVSSLRCRAYLRAMGGELDTGRNLAAAALAVVDELGLKVARAGVLLELARIELLADRPDAAEGAARGAAETLDGIGDRGHLVTVAPVVADALVAQGKVDEAVPFLELTERWAMDDDIDPQIARRRVQAKVLAHRGAGEEAVALAQEAVLIAGRTDWPQDTGMALEDLGAVLRLIGRSAEALPPLEEARRLYEAKGNVVSAARLRSPAG
jgi:class 3 adenylate cyclase/tetratricopeptide (TPR) repeat protein